VPWESVPADFQIAMVKAYPGFNMPNVYSDLTFGERNETREMGIALGAVAAGGYGLLKAAPAIITALDYAAIRATAWCMANPTCALIAGYKTYQPDSPRPPGWDESWTQEYGTREGAGLHWFDSEGGEWRWHAPDPWHNESHWDYNSWHTWNEGWQNFYYDPNSNSWVPRP
jgi:hypothetical protein